MYERDAFRALQDALGWAALAVSGATVFVFRLRHCLGTRQPMARPDGASMTQTTVLGYTTSQLIDAMLQNGIHCSLDAFKRLAIQLQQRALTHEKQEAGLSCDEEEAK
jgi:hypothetical protein